MPAPGAVEELEFLPGEPLDHATNEWHEILVPATERHRADGAAHVCLPDAEPPFCGRSNPPDTKILVHHQDRNGGAAEQAGQVVAQADEVPVAKLELFVDGVEYFLAGPPLLAEAGGMVRGQKRGHDPEAASARMRTLDEITHPCVKFVARADDALHLVRGACQFHSYVLELPRNE